MVEPTVVPNTRRVPSVTVRRAGAIVLGALVVIYLALITVARIRDVVSVRQFFQLAVPWALGVVALILLARSLKSLRREAADAKRTSDLR
jgi:hypothetical protein